MQAEGGPDNTTVVEGDAAGGVEAKFGTEPEPERGEELRVQEEGVAAVAGGARVPRVAVVVGGGGRCESERVVGQVRRLEPWVVAAAVAGERERG